jgi:hypothetical protein
MSSARGMKLLTSVGIGTGSGRDESKNRDFVTGLVRMGFSRDFWGIFQDFSELQNIGFLFFILRLSSTIWVV